VKWLPEHTAALEAIKRGLTSKPLLAAPNPDKPFIVQTDATANSVAAVLTQLGEDGREHVVCYASRKLLPREQRYSTMERECLGIIFAVLKWEQWLFGRKIIVQTDHKPLQWLDSIANHNARLARWNIILQNWDIETQYRNSKNHANADSLSRIETD
jgi:phospholipid-translocating ATPase